MNRFQISHFVRIDDKMKSIVTTHVISKEQATEKSNLLAFEA